MKEEVQENKNPKAITIKPIKNNCSSNKNVKEMPRTNEAIKPIHVETVANFFIFSPMLLNSPSVLVEMGSFVFVVSLAAVLYEMECFVSIVAIKQSKASFVKEDWQFEIIWVFNFVKASSGIWG